MRPLERAGYFIRRVADFEEFWSMPLDDMFYVWPELEFAQAVIPLFLKESSINADRINVYEFINEIIPKLSKQNKNCSVFYGVDNKSWIYSPKEMKEALEEELKQYM